MNMFLMSKDTVVAVINFDTFLFDIKQQDLMPFALRGEGVNLFTLRDWLADRVLSISRSNAKKIIDVLHLNQNDRIGMCFACKALSLTDCYWLKVEGSKHMWKDVNLYDNSLSKAVARVALTGEYISVQGRIRTPELTVNGAYAKCWRRINNELYLYKASSGQDNKKEHLVEILCSDILDILGVEHVKYEEANSGLRKTCRCKNMATQKLSICDMEYVYGYGNRNKINVDAWLRKQPLFFEMLVVDYLINNTDRHTGNWGIYFDADTGKAVSLHPLFDHNLAMYLDGSPMSKVIEGKTLEQCARYAKTKTNITVEKLKKWVSKSDTKKRFKKIFGGTKEYDAFIDRINKYDKM